MDKEFPENFEASDGMYYKFITWFSDSDALTTHMKLSNLMMERKPHIQIADVTSFLLGQLNQNLSREKSWCKNFILFNYNYNNVTWCKRKVWKDSIKMKKLILPSLVVVDYIIFLKLKILSG